MDVQEAIEIAQHEKTIAEGEWAHASAQVGNLSWIGSPHKYRDIFRIRINMLFIIRVDGSGGRPEIQDESV